MRSKLKKWMSHLRIQPAKANSEHDSAAAAWSEQASSLLRGGISAARICAVLPPPAHSNTAGAAAPRNPADLTDPTGQVDTTDQAEWAVVWAAWFIAERSGAPLAPALARIAAALRSLQHLRSRRHVLLAGPRATLRLVAALPLIGWVLAGLLGFDPLRSLTTGWGIASSAIGGCSFVAGIVWVRHLTRRLAQNDSIAGLECEMLWIALGGGRDHESAIRQVIAARDHAQAHWIGIAAFAQHGAVRSVLTAARHMGTPAQQLLLSAADAARSHELRDLEVCAEQFGVQVLIPLGVCVLPAFILLAVVPVLLSVIQGVF